MILVNSIYLGIVYKCLDGAHHLCNSRNHQWVHGSSVVF